MTRAALTGVAWLALVACGSGTADDASASGGESGEGTGGETAAGGASGGQDAGSGGETNSGGQSSSGGLGGDGSGGSGGATDPCDAQPCENAGTCQSEGADSYVCSCTGEFAGPTCSASRLQRLADFIPEDMTPDGRVVVGRSDAPLAIAYVDGQREELEPLLGDVRAMAHGISADGTVIVGVSMDDPASGGYTYRPVVWEGGVATELSVPEGTSGCHPEDVTADGSVIVGICNSSTGEFPRGTIVRWLNGVFDEVPGILETCANSLVSNEGEPIFWACIDEGPAVAGRWTAEDGPTALGIDENCALNAVSADGLAGVGDCYDESTGSSAFRWTDAGGMEPMEGSWLLDESSTEEYASDISDDASFIAGTVEDGGDLVALRWTATGTPQRISDLLTEAGIAAPGWEFAGALAISQDGMTIAGYGYLDEVYTGWIVRLD